MKRKSLVLLIAIATLIVPAWTQTILDKAHGGTGVSTAATFIQSGADINTSFQVISLHIPGISVDGSGNISGNSFISTASGVGAFLGTVGAATTPTGCTSKSYIFPGGDVSGNPYWGNNCGTNLQILVRNGVLPTDISGTFATSQIPDIGALYGYAYLTNLPNNIAAVSHQFVTSYTAATGNFTLAQPAFTDISGTVASAQFPWATLSASDYAVGGGTAQAQTVTLVPALAALAPAVNVCWLPIANNTTSGPTLAVNGLTAKTITKLGSAALIANDLTTTAIACAKYDGAQWILGNPQTVSSSSGTVNNAAQYSLPYYSTSGTTNILSGVASPTANGFYQVGYNVTGGVALAPTATLVGFKGRAVTATTATDTILYSDNLLPVNYQGSVAVATTLPTATTLGNASFATSLINNTSGSSTAVTVTPTTWTINGNATLVVAQGQACKIFVDAAGGAWDGECHDLPILAGTNITLARTQYGLTINATGGGTPAYPVTITGGVSGGIPYFSSTTVESASALQVANSPILGGGAGTAPKTIAGFTTDGTSVVTLGAAGVGTGALDIKGTTSGTAVITVPAIAGTPTITLGSASGTPAVTASGPLSITTATGNMTCTTCATTTNGGALSGTAPIAVSVAGAISITGSAGQIPNGATGAFTATPTLGVAGTTLGTIALAGNTSGTVTLTPQAIAGTVTLTAPNTSGTIADAASAPLSLSATTGALTCPTCTTNAAAATAHVPMVGGGSQAIAASTGGAGTAKQISISGGSGADQSYIDFPDPKTYSAANCVSANPGSAWSTTISPLCIGGSNNLGGQIPFADASTAQIETEIPADWDSTSQPFVNVFFNSGANTTGTVIFNVAVACTKSDGSITADPAFNAADALATKTMAAATRTWSTSIQLTQVTSGNNCVAGGTMLVKLTRATDTAGSVVQFTKMIITTPRLLTVQAD